MAKKSALVKPGTLKDLVRPKMLVLYLVFFAVVYWLGNSFAAAQVANDLLSISNLNIPGVRYSTKLAASPKNLTETGSVTLTSVKGKQTKVTITATNEPAGASQPAAIVSGTCSSLGGSLYTLNNVVSGNSTTTLDVKLGGLEKKVPLSVVVYTSAGNRTQVFCSGILQ